MTVPSSELRNSFLPQRGAVLWFTGFSGAGKSTIADALLERLLRRQVVATVLDGDVVREGLCRDLGFSLQDREENLRRLAEVCALMADAGVVVISAFISPLRASREQARRVIGPDRFLEVYVSTPLAVCEARDVKGLYLKARAGTLKNFTGIDSPFEAPEQPDLSIDTSQVALRDSVDLLEQALVNLGAICSLDLGL